MKVSSHAVNNGQWCDNCFDVGIPVSVMKKKFEKEAMESES